MVTEWERLREREAETRRRLEEIRAQACQMNPQWQPWMTEAAGFGASTPGKGGCVRDAAGRAVAGARP